MATLSRENQAIEAFIAATGVPHVVTATLGAYLSPANPCSPHSPASLHCAPGTGGPGRAVDLADATPSQSAAALLKVFSAFGPVESQLAELICAPAPYAIHNGQRVNGWQIYGTQVMNEHWTHVHVGVGLGVFLPAPAPQPKVAPMYNPPFAVVGKVTASLNAPGGGAWVLTDAGAVYAFGCKDYGAPNRHPEYWSAGRVAAQLEARPDGGYDVIDTAGERYQYPAV